MRPSQKKKKKRKHRDKEGSLATCEQEFIMSCQEHNRGWKVRASVLASMRWLFSGEESNVTSMTVQKKLSSYTNCAAADLSPQRLKIIAKHRSVKKMIRNLINSKKLQL